MKKRNIGSNFDDFLEEQGVKEDVESMASEKVEAVRKESNMEELKPCPCGSSAGEPVYNGKSGNSSLWTICCNTFCGWHVHGRSKKECVEIWNTRTESAELEKLKESYCRVSEEAMKLKEQRDELLKSLNNIAFHSPQNCCDAVSLFQAEAKRAITRIKD